MVHIFKNPKKSLKKKRIYSVLRHLRTLDHVLIPVYIPTRVYVNPCFSHLSPPVGVINFQIFADLIGLLKFRFTFI